MKYFIHRKINPVRVEVRQHDSRYDLLKFLYSDYDMTLEFDYNMREKLKWDINSRFCINWNNECDVKKQIVVDELGRIISPIILIEWFGDYRPQEKRPSFFMSWRNTSIYNWLGFRNGPVPYTGVGNYRCSSGGIKIGSELRASQDREFTRKKRSFTRLSTDAGYGRRSRRTRGWKNSKKEKQWM